MRPHPDLWSLPSLPICRTRNLPCSSSRSHTLLITWQSWSSQTPCRVVVNSIYFLILGVSFWGENPQVRKLYFWLGIKEPLYQGFSWNQPSQACLGNEKDSGAYSVEKSFYVKVVNVPLSTSIYLLKTLPEWCLVFQCLSN